MSSTTSSAALHVSRNSARRMVRQLHNHAEEQRRVVMECRNRAEAMSASGILRDGCSDLQAEQPSLMCFAEVASEKSMMQSFIPDGLLSGIAVAVSEALDVQEFFRCSGLCAPMFHHGTCKEFPLISWLRCQGAQFVGKLRCSTPFALNEGTVFCAEKPTSIALAEHACDYAISCSLNGPSAILCAAHHDVVGFKPTSQTFGTFTERFELPMPSMTVGLSARCVDDLMYLWQAYTSSIDPETYFDSATTKRTQSSMHTTGGTIPSSRPFAPTDSDASSSAATAADSKGGHSTANAARDAAPLPTVSTTEAPRGCGSGHQRTSDLAARLAQSISSWWSGKAAPAAKHPDDTPKYALPEILDHSPHNYTVRDRRGHIADIDVGWLDYNAKAAMTDDFNQPSRPGFLRRLLTGVQAYETPRVELAVGYPAEWIDRYCTSKYTSSAEFHQRITDAVRRHSALHYNQKLEIVPLAFDFSLEEVMEALAVISNYEIAKAFERQFAPSAIAAADVCAKATTQADEDPKSSKAQGQSGSHGSGKEHSTMSCPKGLPQLAAAPGMEPGVLGGCDAPAPNPPSTFVGFSDVQEGLPATLLESIQTGQKLSIRDYHCALRVRDDVVRSNEEQFMDVDCFATPLLSDPYRSGDVRSVRLLLPFQLAGNPILSVQMDPQTPVALVGQLGRDAALMEDAFCFLQFVRGASSWCWHQKVFGKSAVATAGAGKGCSSGAAATFTSSPAAGSTAFVP